MSDEPDYTVVVDEPPDPAETGGGVTAASSPLMQNLVMAKYDHPGQWVRIATYASSNTADVTASQLRNGRRLKGRPEGLWEFKSGPTPDERFGVWARWIDPDVEPEADAE